MTATQTRPARATRPRLARRRRWPLLLAVGLIAALLAAAVIVWFTPVLGLRKITVSGVTGELADQVRAAVDTPAGTPLMRVDLAAAVVRVQAVAPIASARVVRAWPNGLTVTVKQRVPVARTSANGAVWLMDASGLPYVKFGPGVPVPAGLPTVELATPRAGDTATTAVLLVVASLTPALKAQLETIRAPSAFDITLVLADGREVFWGGSDHAAEKLAALPGVLTRTGHRYDISVPGVVVVR